MTGTFINVTTILAGSLLGTTLGGRLAPRFRELIMQALGLTTAVIALQMALLTKNVSILTVTVSLVLGGILGEALNLDLRLNRLGQRLEQRLARPRNSSPAPTSGADASAERTTVEQGAAEAAASSADPKVPAVPARAGGGNFSRGFVMASLVFCVGPMAILGSFQDGLTGDFRLLTIKALLDGVAATAFSASLGIGVAFSAVSVLLYQGSLSLLAGLFSRLLNQPMIDIMTVTGGIIILGLSLVLLEVKQIRVANMLPAIFVAPALVRLFAWAAPLWTQYLGFLMR